MHEYTFPVAMTILEQMGGIRKLQAFTGAHSFVRGEVDVTFQWPMQARSKPNALKVTLTPADTYTLTFYRIAKGYDPPVVLSTFDDIYCDQLVEIFERETGLYLSL